MTLASTNALTTFFLPSVLEHFLANRRNVDVTVLDGEWWEVIRLVESGTAQVGLGAYVPGGANYHCEAVVKARLGLCFRPNHPVFSRLARSKNFNLDCLAQETLLLLASEVQEVARGNVWEKLIPPPKTGKGRRITVVTYGEIKSFVRQGVGVGIIHDLLMTPEDEGIVSWMDLSDKLGGTDLGLYLPCGGKNAIESEFVRDLVKSVEIAGKALATKWKRIS